MNENWNAREFNEYAFVLNAPLINADYLGMQIVAPPVDFLKPGECKQVSLNEFMDLQAKWGERITNGKSEKTTLSSSEQVKIGQGCIGLCQASINMEPHHYPEESDKAECWAGPMGEALAMAEGKKKCDRKPVVVFSKRGKWADWARDLAKKNGDKLPAYNSKNGSAVIGDGRFNRFDYLTKLGGEYYIDAEGHLKTSEAAILTKKNILYDLKAINICRGPMKATGYPAEIWCYRCCQGNTGGYRDEY